MSLISGVSSANFTPATAQLRPKEAATPPPPPPAQSVQPAGKDADGDNDGSKGGTIDTFA